MKGDDVLAPVYIEDPPDPDLPELQQRDLPMPTVPVEVEGKVRVLRLPNRSSSVEAFAMDATLRRVMGADPKRARAVLVSSVAWRYARSTTGTTFPVPANIIFPISHADEVCARAETHLFFLSGSAKSNSILTASHPRSDWSTSIL